MKTKSILLLLLAISFAFSSCKKDEIYVTPSGNITTVTNDVSGISKLDISDPFRVYITSSDADEKLEVEANSNLQGYIKVMVRNNTLVVKLDDKINIRHDDATLNLYISMKTLEKVAGSGATRFYLENSISGSELNINLTGACHLSGTVNFDHMTVTLEGASGMNVSGTVGSLVLDEKGASIFGGYNFLANNLSADLSGASSAKLTIKNQMEIKASGASNVYYKGDAYIAEQDLRDISMIVKVE